MSRVSIAPPLTEEQKNYYKSKGDDNWGYSEYRPTIPTKWNDPDSWEYWITSFGILAASIYGRHLSRKMNTMTSFLFSSNIVAVIYFYGISIKRKESMQMRNLIGA